MITAGEAFDFPTLVQEAKAALMPMLDLSGAEREFVRLLHIGELRPEVLYPSGIAERLAHHPHLLWKVENVRKHLAKEAHER